MTHVVIEHQGNMDQPQSVRNYYRVGLSAADFIASYPSKEKMLEDSWTKENAEAKAYYENRYSYTRVFSAVPIDSLIYDWHERERLRLVKGVHERINWKGITDRIGTIKTVQIANAIRLSHSYPYLSAKAPGKIGYTESHQKGLRDIQSPIKPGKFLVKIGCNEFLNGQEIADVAALISKQNSQAVLKFAKSADEIENVYRSGPTSCMSHGLDHFNSSVHPTRVYGDSDIQLAYMVREKEGESRITARALVWPENMYHSTIYGDELVFQPLLESAGYSKAHDFDGAKIRHIQDSGSVLMPYLDCGCGADIVDSEWLSIGGDDLCTENTGGLASSHEYTCDNCGEGCDELTEVVDNGDWCNCCAENTSYCDYNERSYHESEVTYYSKIGLSLSDDAIENGPYSYCDHNEEYYDESEVQYYGKIGLSLSQDALAHGPFSYCKDCNDWHGSEDVIHTESVGRDVCHSCLADDYWLCTMCEEMYPNSQPVGSRDFANEPICEDCTPEEEEGEEND